MLRDIDHFLFSWLHYRPDCPALYIYIPAPLARPPFISIENLPSDVALGCGDYVYAITNIHIARDHYLFRTMECWQYTEGIR